MSNMGIKEEVKEELQDLDARMAEERKKKDGSRLGVVDLITEKVLSRKLLVWIVSTVLLAKGMITPDEWSGITLGYIGLEGVADIVTKYKAAKKG